MTLPSRHRIRNSSSGDLRLNTPPLGHEVSPQCYIFTNEQGRNILFLWNLKARVGLEPTILTFQWISFNHCTMAPVPVITDYVCDTESVIIAIRKVVPQISGAQTIDCAMKIWCRNSISQLGQNYYLKMWKGLYLFCYNQYQCSQVTASSLDQWFFFIMTYLHLIGITLELKRQHL